MGFINEPRLIIIPFVVLGNTLVTVFVGEKVPDSCLFQDGEDIVKMRPLPKMLHFSKGFFSILHFLKCVGSVP